MVTDPRFSRDYGAAPAPGRAMPITPRRTLHVDQTAWREARAHACNSTAGGLGLRADHVRRSFDRAVGSALESDGSGTIVNTSVVGNVATTFSPAGVASTTGGLGVFDTDLVTVKNATISENLTVARSDTGSAEVLGGVVFNNTLLTMDHVVVSHNTARATGPDGDAQGGGIWNGDLITGPPVLTLVNSSVVGNALEASPGIPRAGRRDVHHVPGGQGEHVHRRQPTRPVRGVLAIGDGSPRGGAFRGGPSLRAGSFAGTRPRATEVS
jgi:hypothetical protein